MKALTVQQPWAWAISEGGKRVENRRWATDYRGALLIHASASRQRVPRDGWEREEASHDWREQYGSAPPPWETLDYGCVVAVSTLAACLTARQCRRGHPDHPWLRTHPHVEGPWCLVLSDVLPLPRPVPCRGLLGLWDVPPDVVLAVQDQVARIARGG